MFLHLTQIETTSGSRPIREIREGRTIMAYAAGAVVNVPVKRAVAVDARQITQVRLSNAVVVECTPDQLFYVPSKGYISAAGLQPGDSLRSFDGRQVYVVKIGYQPFRTTAYAIETAIGNYFAAGILAGCVADVSAKDER